MFTLASDIYPGGFGPSYSYYQRPASPPGGCRNNYYGILAETRTIESEVLAQEAARREEEVLERRLQELRRSHLTPRSYSYDLAPYQRCPPDDWSDQPSDNLLETLRVAEEEQIARLEALRQKRHKLEEEERSKVAAQFRRRKIEAEKLAQHEKARRLRDLAIAEEEQKIRRLIQGQMFEKATNTLQQTVQPGANPRTRHDSYHKPQDALELVVELARGIPVPAELPGKNADVPDGPLSRSNKRRRLAASTSLQTTDLTNLLQQLGLLTATNEGQSAPEKEEKELPVPLTSLQQLGANVKRFTSSEPVTNKDERKLSPLPKDSVPTSPEITVKEQLEGRLQGEYANEVRDTILALLNSLSDIRTTTSGVSHSSKSQASSSDKGKAKASESDVEPASPITKDVKNIMNRVREIESRFHALENEFEFPDKLDFTPTSPTMSQSATPTPVTFPLMYTATNQPVHYYEQALSSLLAQLDSIESHGSEELRNKRKDVVRKVGNALEDLEQRVEARWKTSKRRTVTIEDVTTSDEHLVTPEYPSFPLVSEDIQAAGETAESTTSSTAPQQSEGPAPAVKGSTRSIAGEAPESTTFDFKHAIIEATDRNQPIPEKIELAQDEPLEEVPVSAPAEKFPGVLETLIHTTLEGTSLEGQSNAPTAQPLSPSSENPGVEDSLPILQAVSGDLTNHSPTTSFSGHLPGPIIEPQHAISNPGLAAATRTINCVASGGHLPSFTTPESSELESDLSETEAEGTLLENGVVEASRDISDNESTSSDWSEVDGVASR